jgi:hypothetical protein
MTLLGVETVSRRQPGLALVVGQVGASQPDSTPSAGEGATGLINPRPLAEEFLRGRTR